MAAVVDPLHVPPRPWHKVGLDFLTTCLDASASFSSVLVVVDHLTRVAHFFPCITDITG
jgi:hypothetical protein